MSVYWCYQISYFKLQRRKLGWKILINKAARCSAELGNVVNMPITYFLKIWLNIHSFLSFPSGDCHGNILIKPPFPLHLPHLR